jgi:hypothetical protein
LKKRPAVCVASVGIEKRESAMNAPAVHLAVSLSISVRPSAHRSPTPERFVPDSPLEEDGFELSVPPPHQLQRFRDHHASASSPFLRCGKAIRNSNRE